MDGDIGVDLVKGIGHARGVMAEVPLSELLKAQESAETAFKAAMAPLKRGYGTDEDWDRIAPELRGALMARKFSGADQMLGELRANFQQLATELNKDITLSSPLSTGLVPYDLAAPAKQLYPVYSPLRNKIPRVRGMGSARRFKKITQISGSNAVFSNIFMAELPGGSMGVLNLPPAISLTGADGTVNYQFAGLGNNASLVAEIAGRGFQDIDALLNQTLLQAMMLNEEAAMLFSRTANLAAPTGLTVTAQTPVAPNTALTGVTTTVWVRVTAISEMGETVGSSVASVSPTAAQDVKIAWTDVPGATGYRVYVSTGAADPGDASRFLAATVRVNTFELGGALPTAGTTVPLTNTTTTTNGYMGIVQDLATNGGYSARLNAGFSTGGIEFQTAFTGLWNTTRADPDEIWLAGPDRSQLARQIINAGSSNTAYRVAYQMDNAGHIVGGQVVTSMYNEVTGKELPITVHPWLPQGTALILSYKTPFPYSETPNIWENVMVQDYLGLAFPNIDLARRFAIIQYGALVDYAPSFNAVLQGVLAGG